MMSGASASLPSLGSSLIVCRFDLSCHRHTGEWLCLYRAVTLDEALRVIGEGMHFQPC
jgi:hypothetical protein